MNSRNIPSTCFTLALSALLIASPLISQAQTIPKAADHSGSPANSEDETIVLSPFEVNTTQDKGYRVTNSTSGTRLNTPIKDVPMNLEVITSDFIRDTGAQNLREALRYSAGIVLDSQNDAFSTNDYDPSSAGYNDPRGATRNSNGTTTKIRGFVVDQTLRDGFRRQNSTDSTDIERIEVVRGPSALLYGTGSFGGIVNYIPKRPQLTPAYEISATVGNNGLFRTTLDATGPILNKGVKIAYRLNGSLQENGDSTDLFNRTASFLAPSLLIKPFEKTSIIIDTEFGYEKQRGVGFQGIRGNQNDGWRGAPFLHENLINPRTFRWSGPDTFLKSPTSNILVDLTQGVGENLFFKVGYDHSKAEFDGRNINGTSLRSGIFAPTDPINYTDGSHVNLGGTTYGLRDAIAAVQNGGTFNGFTLNDILAARPIGTFRGDSLYGTLTDEGSLGNLDPNNPNPSGPQILDQVAIRYQWQNSFHTTKRDQIRAEGTYKLDLGKWGKHTFLVGTSIEGADDISDNFSPPESTTTPAGVYKYVPDNERYSYHGLDDLGYFYYGRQGDGRADPEMKQEKRTLTRNWGLGYYAVYQGSFWSDRISLIGGARWDRTDARQWYDDYWKELHQVQDRSDKKVYGPSQTNAPTQTSPQIGLSFAITKEISVFGLYSTGNVPNYFTNDGWGQAFKPTTAKNTEYGVKFDLFSGKISGTVSAYTIKRKGVPKYIWWAPNPYQAILDGYNPSKSAATLWQNMSPSILWYTMKNTPDGLNVAKRIFPTGWKGVLESLYNMPASSDPAHKYEPDPNAMAANPKIGAEDFALGTTVNGSTLNWGANGHWNAPGAWWGAGGLMATAGANTGNINSTSDVYFPLLNFSDAAATNFLQTAAFWGQSDWAGNFADGSNGAQYRFGDGTMGTANNPGASGANVPIDDQAKGWDAQVIFSPTNQLQIVANFAHVDREITTKNYKYVKAPYFPFANWFKPQLGWGTMNGKLPVDAYTDPTDSSTSNVTIQEFGQSLDDTPKDTAALWVHYSFERFSLLKNFSAGIGGNWAGRRQWFSGYEPSGNAVTYTGANGQLVLAQYWTKTQTTVNLVVDYKIRIADKYNLRCAFNVDNLLDDQRKYGFVYAPGAAYRFTTSLSF
jgi:outer membrane receptor protein involved in Fe transport